MSMLILAVFLLVPCMAYGAEEMECAYMTVAPSSVSLDTGQYSDIFITVLDKNKSPITNHRIVAAVRNRPELIAVEPLEALTDETGKAIFRLKGLNDLEDWCPLEVFFTCKDREALMHIY